MLLAISMMVLFFLSATPFCCGVYRVVNCLCIPYSLQNFRNSFEIYSPPLSVLNTFMCSPLWFSTSALKFWNFSKTSLLFLRKYIQVFLVKSSMNVKKYRLPANDGACIGPHKSEWIISKGVFALMLFPDGKLSLCCFPKMQPSHRLSGFSINGNPFTIPFLLNKFRPPKLRCPNLKCHNQFSSFGTLWKASWVTAAISLLFFMSALIRRGNILFLVILTSAMHLLLGGMSMMVHTSFTK